MEVKINIESGQIGDTVIDLFKNLSDDKKEELALTILKEWLQSPEFFETKNKEQLVIEEFKSGKRSSYSSWDKYNADTTDDVIKRDYNYQKALNEYRTSKQILVEDIKNEIVNYYKKYISDELINNEKIQKIKQETFDEIQKQFPQIIMQTMMNVFSSNLISLQSQISNSAMQSNMALGMAQSIQDRLR